MSDFDRMWSVVVSVLLCMSKSSSKLSTDSPSVFSAMAVIFFLEAALGAVGSLLRVFLAFLGMLGRKCSKSYRHFSDHLRMPI